MPSYDQELLERYAKTESTVEALLDMQRRTDQKIDTILNMQIQIASMQESARNHAEKLDKLFTSDGDKEKRLKIVESKMNKGIGMIGIIVVVVLPVSGWILSNAYSQISAIDRRLLGIEYQMQKPIQMNH